MDIDAPTSSQDLENTPDGSATSNTTAKEEGPEVDVIMTTNPPSINTTAKDPVDYFIEMEDSDTPTPLQLSTLQNDLDTTSDNESEDEVTIYDTDNGSDEEDDNDECPSFDNDEEIDAIIDGGDIIIDNCTKLDIFAPALYWLDVMMKNADISPAITKRIGIIYQSQYKKVITLIKSSLPSSTEEETSEPNTTFVSVSSFNNEQVAQLDVICQETAQLILEEFTGYTGDLLESIELMLGGRVSTGTEGHNDGRSQGAKLLAIIKLLFEKKHFKLEVVLHKRFMLAIGYKRKYPERCDAVYEAIKATLFSKYRGIHLFINDSFRMFYGSVQHRFLLGVLKALNPKRDIDISFGTHGLMPTKGNELIIDTINTRQHQYRGLETEISHISASSCVPVDPKSKDPPQDEIDTKAKELYKSWDKARQIPQKYKDAIARGKEYSIEENDLQLTKRDYRAAVKNSKNRLKVLRFEHLTSNDRDKLKDLDFNQLTLHERSQTEKGSSILQEESDGYFGLQSDDQASSVDIAALLRTSTMNKQTTGMKVHNALHLDGVPIDQLASIVACIEIRKKHKLLPENAELKFIFYERGSKRVAIMTEDYCKLVHVTKSRGIGYIFTANLNRINSESIAVQMLLEVERIISKFQVIPTRESGKKRLSIIEKEDERANKYQGITGVCKSKVDGIEQLFEEVKSNPILDKAVKDICGRRMRNDFLEDVAVVHKNTSYPPFPIPCSSQDQYCMELMVVLNKQAEKKLAEKVDGNNEGRWTSEEHERFVSAYNMYGNDWTKVASVVKTRTRIQTRTHAQKYILKLQKAAAEADPPISKRIVSSPIEDEKKVKKRKQKKVKKRKPEPEDSIVVVDGTAPKMPLKSPSPSLRSVRFTVTKPEDGELGLTFEWSQVDGAARVTGLSPGCVFIMTPLTTGMILESVNGTKCNGFDHTHKLLSDAKGEIIIIAKRLVY